MDPFEVLGVPATATDEDIRAAYLSKVREHPPEQVPEQFERIRDAYERLRDPRRRMQHRLFDVDPAAPFVSLLDTHKTARQFAGPDSWLQILKRKDQTSGPKGAA